MKESNLTDQKKTMEGEDPKDKEERRRRAREEHAKTMKGEDPKDKEERRRRAEKEHAEEKKRYLDNFEDTDNTHTAEQKLDVKKEKLFKFIEGITENLTDEEKTKIVELEKWLIEQNKPRKGKELPWVIIREEKSKSTTQGRGEHEIFQGEIRFDEEFSKDFQKNLKAREKRHLNPPTKKESKKKKKQEFRKCPKGTFDKFCWYEEGFENCESCKWFEAALKNVVPPKIMCPHPDCFSWERCVFKTFTHPASKEECFHFNDYVEAEKTRERLEREKKEKELKSRKKK